MDSDGASHAVGRIWLTLELEIPGKFISIIIMSPPFHKPFVLWAGQAGAMLGEDVF